MLVIFIKAVAELGVIPYTHLFYSKFLACHKTEENLYFNENNALSA